MSAYDVQWIRAFLAGTPRLATLPAAIVSGLVDHAEVQLHAPGEVLIRRGEVARHLYVAVSGLLEARAPREKPGEEHVGWFTRGDLMGEMALVTGEKRSATVTTHRHAVVIAIPYRHCRDAILEDPDTRAAFVSLLWERIRAADRRTRPAPTAIAIMSASRASDGLQSRLARVIGERPRAAFVTPEMALAALGSQILQASCDVPLARWLDRQEDDREEIFWTLTAQPSAWRDTLMSRCDAIMVLLSDDASPEERANVQESLNRVQRQQIHIVCIGTDDRPIPTFAAPGPLRVHRLTSPDADQTRLLLERLHDDLGRPSRLRAFDLFRDLRPDQLARLQDDITWMVLPGGHTLIAEGQNSDHVYFVETGRFRLSRTAPEGPESLGDIGHGATIGEVAFLTNGPRTATVQAVRDSTIAAISNQRFAAVLDEFPSVGRRLSRNLAHTLARPPTARRGGGPRNLVVFTRPGAPGNVPEALCQVLRRFGRRVRLVTAEAVERALGQGASQLPPDAPHEPDLIRWLHAQEMDHDHLVFSCGPTDSTWTRRCLRHADRLVIAAMAAGDSSLHPLERRLAEVHEKTARPPVHLALHHPAGIREATGTARWLALRPGVTHHHLRAGNNGDLERMMRRLLDSACGVALAGAADRGPAHLGVARAMDELGLPIDLLAGSSSGAALAGLLVLPLSPQERMRRAMRMVAQYGVRFSRMQPPLTSLMSGAASRRLMRETYGDHRLEDQLIPATLTAVDIRRRQLVRMRTGPLWLAVRASMSLPFLWPPVWRGDQLLIDGGLLSYMPIEELLKVCSGGLAVASDLDIKTGQAKPAFARHKDYGDTLSGWKQLAQKLNPFARGERYPSALSVLLHVMFLPSFHHQAHIRDLEKLPHVQVLRPQVTHKGFFGASEESIRTYERLAYEKALDKLTPHRAAISRLSP